MPRYTYLRALADKFEFSSLFNLVPEVDPTTEDFLNAFTVLVCVNNQSFKGIAQRSGSRYSSLTNSIGMILYWKMTNHNHKTKQKNVKKTNKEQLNKKRFY